MSVACWTQQLATLEPSDDDDGVVLHIGALTTGRVTAPWNAAHSRSQIQVADVTKSRFDQRTLAACWAAALVARTGISGRRCSLVAVLHRSHRASLKRPVSSQGVPDEGALCDALCWAASFAALQRSADGLHQLVPGLLEFVEPSVSRTANRSSSLGPGRRWVHRGSGIVGPAANVSPRTSP